MEKNTKERIIDAAIDLFSKRGYAEVSMQDIAQAVGIKKASIYSHFQSKEQIMDTILDDFVRELSKPGNIDTDMDRLVAEQGFDGMMLIAWRDYAARLEDETLLKTWRVINLEQNRNERIRSFYIETIMESPIRAWEDMFTKMIESRIFRPYDPKVLAMEFFGFCVYLLTRYFLLEPEMTYGQFMEVADPLMAEHIRFFYTAIKV